MKNQFLFTTVLVAGFAASAQPLTVPASVLQSFDTKFAGAKAVKWDKENDHEFEAEFKVKGLEMSAAFSTDGTWMETETEIGVKALPAAIVDALQAAYPGYEVEEAETVEKPGMATQYEVEIKGNGKTMEVELDASGKVLKATDEATDED